MGFAKSSTHLPSVSSQFADQVLGAVPRHLTGACIEDVNHEIYGGIYSQMIFGESFQEPPPSPSLNGFKVHGGFWTARDGTASITGTDGPDTLTGTPRRFHKDFSGESDTNSQMRRS